MSQRKRITGKERIGRGGYGVTRIREKLWHIHFLSGYDLNMHFFRFQEYYEGAAVKGESLQVVDLIERYTDGVGKGSFSYMSDWSGFNLPLDNIFRRVRAGITDINRYDQMMISVAEYVKAKERTEDCYLIGTSDDDKDLPSTFNHELAHGLFYTHPGYKHEMVVAVDRLPERVRTKTFEVLKEWGYEPGCHVDECQAYLATGLQAPLTRVASRYRKEFVGIFNRHTKGIRRK